MNASLYFYSLSNLSNSQKHLNQRKMKWPGFHNTKKKCSWWIHQIWTWLREVMSCSAEESAFLFSFYKQLVAGQKTLHGESARYAHRRGCRHCEGWIMTSLKMFLWLKVWNGKLAPLREDLTSDLFNPAGLRTTVEADKIKEKTLSWTAFFIH